MPIININQLNQLMNSTMVYAVVVGLVAFVVALIVAPVLTTAKAAKINWKTVAIPIIVALFIYSKVPFISNPITFIIAGGLGGYVYYIKHQNGSIANKKEASK